MLKPGRGLNNMAKQEVYWFKHDGNARRDIKIIEMMSVYGAEGYGWYWILLEIMRESRDYKLKIRGKYAYKALAIELKTDQEQAKQYIEDCINEFNLFESDGQFIWSPSFLRRMTAYNEVCEKRREAVNSRWNKA